MIQRVESLVSSQLSRFQTAMVVGRNLKDAADRRFQMKVHSEDGLDLRIDSNYR